MKTLKRAEGNWVEAERFWNREDDLRLFIEHIDEGAHLLLVAQRRIGKTSLMREAARRIADRYICLQVDLQKASSSAEAVMELSVATRPYKNLWGKTKEVFRNILDAAVDAIDSVDVKGVGIKLRDGLSAGDWKTKGDKVFAILAASEVPVVVFLDEVPILVNRLLKGEDYTLTPERRKQADEFMSWLRDNSIRHKGSLRMVLSGSIGFEPVLRQAGLSATINTFLPFELKPWDEEIALGCLEALGNEYGVSFERGAREEILKRLACYIPHHVQMFFSHIYESCKRRGDMTCSSQLVGEVYREQMLGPRGHAELSHYEERLKMVLGEEIMPLAIELLSEAATVGVLAPQAARVILQGYEIEDRDPSQLLREILDVLEHDGYLHQTPNGYVFVSKLLQDWWAGHYRFSFTPAADRGESQ